MSSVRSLQRQEGSTNLGQHVQEEGDLSKRVVSTLTNEELEEEKKRIQATDSYKWQTVQKDLKRFPEAYGKEYSTGKRAVTVVVCVLVATVGLSIIGVLGLTFAGQLTTFPQHILHFLQSSSPLHIGLGVGIPVVLVSGVIIIMARARYGNEKLLGEKTTIGTLKGDQQYELVYINHTNSSGYHIGYADKSQLDESGSGKAYVYGHKPPSEHALVSSCVFLGTPFITIGTIVYHTIRTVIIPFYIAFRLIQQACSKDKKDNEREYELIDLVKEPALSLWRVVKAPFYGLAYMAAAFYSFFNPLGGRKLGGAIERDWNEGMTLKEGYWSTQSKQRFFTSETDGRPVGYFLAGCWQPISVANYQNGKITEFESYAYLVSHREGYASWRKKSKETQKTDDKSYTKESVEGAHVQYHPDESELFRLSAIEEEILRRKKAEKK